MLNLRQIEAFRAVIETGTVSRAAERLSISQPAVTKLIQNLEHGTGLQLFRRTPGRVSPTAEAMLLFDEVERIFKGLTGLASFVGEIRALHHGHLRVGVMPALSTGFIQDVLAEFIEGHPMAQVAIHARSTVRLVEWLVAGHLDIALTSHTIEHPEVTLIPLCRHKYVCILPLDHPLTARKSLVPQDLAGERFISFGRGAFIRDDRNELDEIFQRAGVARLLRYEADMSQTVCAMVAKGLGVSMINPLHIGSLRDVIAQRPITPTIESEIRILLPRHRQQSLATKAFVERAQAHVAGLPS